MGREQQFRIAISHDESIQKVLYRFSQLDMDFQFSVHQHQTWQRSVVCWFAESNKWCNLRHLEQAIHEDRGFATMHNLFPDAKVECKWDVVRT